LFRISENQSIFEYVRTLRLERAFAALRSGEVTVQEASAIAGYSTAANFATAFRRQFATTPRTVMLTR
jgi:AraC-like DNA-binding protein